MITISNVITVENPSAELMKWCQQNLKLKNPEYEKKQRMHFWVGKTPQWLYLYETRGDKLILPFGVLRDILPMVNTDEIQTAFQVPERIDYGCKVPLYDYQEKAVEDVYWKQYGILQSAAGSGKGLPLDATVYTPTGKCRMGDLKVGDSVLNTYGSVSKVTHIFDRGLQPCFTLTFSDGTEIVCDSSHLWSVIDHYGKPAVMSAEDLYHNGIFTENGRRKYHIPTTKPVEFRRRDVPINPWLFGFLIGDGYFGNEITFSTSERDLLDRVVGVFPDGVIKPKSGYDYRIVDGAKTRNALTSLGLTGKHSWEKFIPDCYKYNDIHTRIAVLQGYMDADGSISGTTSSVTSTSDRLIADILEIVESLGGTGRFTKRNTRYVYRGEERVGRPSYRLHFKLPVGIAPGSSQKHLSKLSHRTKYADVYRKLVDIKPHESMVTRCITVDSEDSLFLTDHFVPTHNTQMGIALIAKLGKRALWLTHTVDLLQQSKQRAEQYMDKSLLGTITGGKVNIGKGITFATVQTMCNLDLALYKDYWDVIIVDECHRVAGTPTAVSQFSKVLNSLAARHKYGLSATVHRSDGLIAATFALLGDVIYAVPEEAVADKIMKVGICPIPTGVGISRVCLNTDGTLNYAKLINYLCDNEERTDLIVQHLVENRWNSSLILSDRLEHLHNIIDALPLPMQEYAVMVSGKMTTKKGKAEREQAIADMRSGAKKYLFATYSLCKEGLDIPRLERLYMTTPQKDYAVITQSIGRIARTFPGKSQPIVYDFVDDIQFLVKAYKKRCTTYRKNGAYFVER